MMLISGQQQVGNLERIDKGICRNLHVAEIPMLPPAIEKLQRRDPWLVQIHARVLLRGEGKGSVAHESLGIVARIMRATILGDVGHRAFHNEPSGQRSASMQALAYFCSDSFKVRRVKAPVKEERRKNAGDSFAFGHALKKGQAPIACAADGHSQVGICVFAAVLDSGQKDGDILICIRGSAEQ